MDTTLRVSDSCEAPGDGRAAARLAIDLTALDPEGWAALLPLLKRVADSVAARFGDVVSREDALGDLALFAHDRWLADWADRVAQDAETRSLEVFLRDRLRDHLRERRRKERRRRALLRPLGIGPAVETGRDEQPVAAAWYASEPPAPDAGLEAEGLRTAASVDEQARALVLLRESGFSHAEIAAALHLSRPTVTRRLAAAAAALVALVGVLWLAVWWRPEPAAPVAIEPEALPVEVPAAAPEPAEVLITLATDPPGAVVFVDGEEVGRSPVRIAAPPEGEHRAVRLWMDGYATRELRIGHRTQPEVTVALDRTPQTRWLVE
ncbi:MAG: PEGA domain-containing protein [Sandaracinaceae bacterium]|nr:PEGA domain-containing protein [Sandaracinaceae bacterium]